MQFYIVIQKMELKQFNKHRKRNIILKIGTKRLLMFLNGIIKILSLIKLTMMK